MPGPAHGSGGGEPMAPSPKPRRPREPMPDSVRNALDEAGLWKSYRARPAYQQNDYLLWINSAKRPATKEKRLRQMLDELTQGGVYMNMPHAPSRKR